MPFLSLSRVIWISRGSLSKYFIPHSHFHHAINEVGKPAFEPCLFPSNTDHAALELPCSVWDSHGVEGPVWLTGDHLPTGWKSKAQKCQLSPVKKELCGWKWKLPGFYSWLWFLSICLLTMKVYAVSSSWGSPLAWLICTCHFCEICRCVEGMDKIGYVRDLYK